MNCSAETATKAAKSLAAHLRRLGQMPGFREPNTEITWHILHIEDLNAFRATIDALKFLMGRVIDLHPAAQTSEISAALHNARLILDTDAFQAMFEKPHDSGLTKIHRKWNFPLIHAFLHSSWALIDAVTPIHAEEVMIECDSTRLLPLCPQETKPDNTDG